MSHLEHITDVNLDLNGKKNTVVIDAKQGDINRYIRVHLKMDGNVVTIPDGNEVIIRAAKPDGTTVLRDCTIEEGGKSVLGQLTYQALAVKGLCDVDFCIIDSEDNAKISTSTFKLRVNPSAYGDKIDSNDDLKALDKAFLQIDDITEEVGDLFEEANEILNKIEEVNKESPMIEEDGYWYIYDSKAKKYIKTKYKATANIDTTLNNPDSDEYVLSEKALVNHFLPKTVTIAGISLENNISDNDLLKAISVGKEYRGTQPPKVEIKYNTGDKYLNAATGDYYYYYINEWKKIGSGGGGGTAYTAGDGIDISDDTISVDDTVAKVNDVVPKTRTIANLNLSSDIPARSLCSALGVDTKLDTENIDTELNHPESDGYVLSEKALVNHFAMFTHGSIIPNENTEGYKGEHRWSFVGNRLFVCVGKNGENFVWKEIPTNEYIVNLINTCFLKTDVASTFSTDEGKVYSTNYINALVGNIGQIQQEVDDLVGE